MIQLSQLRRNMKVAGFSIVEAVTAMAVGAVAVAGGMSLNEQELRMVKTSRETSAASLTLEERVEQLRIATWRQITDPAYLVDTYMPVRPRSVAALANFTERVQVSAFPDPSVCASLVVERKNGGSPVIIADGTGLAGQRLAKVSVQVRWAGKNNRPRAQELATIISNGGISRMNLAAMGTSSVFGESTSTGGGTTGSSGGTTTTTTATTTTTTASASGTGRGTVGGKSGKK